MVARGNKAMNQSDRKRKLRHINHSALAHSIHTFVASKALHVKESIISTLVEDIFSERSKFVLIRIVKRSISC